MLTQVAKASAWDKSDNELSHEQREYVRNPGEEKTHREQQERINEWRFKKLTPDLKLAKKNELHVSLGIPKPIGIEIHNWAEEQDWPEGTELEPIEDYHITLLYSPEGYSHQDDPWMDHEAHAVSIKGIKAFPSKEREDKDAIVLTVDSETIAVHHKDLASEAEGAGIEISPYSFDDFKPHITIAYGLLPSGLKPPKLTFETDQSSVSPPRESAWKFGTILYHGTGDPRGIEATGLPAGASLATDPELAEEYAESADQPLTGGEPAVFEVHVSPQHLQPDWPSLSEPVGWGGMTGKEMEDAVAQRLAEKEHLDAFDSMDLVGAAKHMHPIPPHNVRRISHWHIKQIRAPYEAELLKFADSWQPRDSWPNALRERNGEPVDADCTCKDGHKLDCPIHGMHPTLPTYDDTLEFRDPSSPVGYDYHADGPRTWMRAETKVTGVRVSKRTDWHLAKGYRDPERVMKEYERRGPWGCEDGARWLAANYPGAELQVGRYWHPEPREDTGTNDELHYWAETPDLLLDPNGEARGEPRIQTTKEIEDGRRQGTRGVYEPFWYEEDTNSFFDPKYKSFYEAKTAADEFDTREYQDSRMMPDMIETPNATNPHPEKQGCTCDQGHKLDCPVHGLNSTEQDFDHSWSIPQGHPVGYPDSQPRAYMKAEGSVIKDSSDYHDTETDGHSNGHPKKRLLTDGCKGNA